MGPSRSFPFPSLVTLSPCRASRLTSWPSSSSGACPQVLAASCQCSLSVCHHHRQRFLFCFVLCEFFSSFSCLLVRFLFFVCVCVVCFLVADLSMGPTRDAEFAAEFLEDRLADVDALADLEEGHLKVLGELLEREFLLARSDNASRRRQRRRSRRNGGTGCFVT